MAILSHMLLLYDAERSQVPPVMRLKKFDLHQDSKINLAFRVHFLCSYNYFSPAEE